MMFFVHPQIQLDKRIFSSFFKKPDLSYLKKKLHSYFPDKQIVFTDMGRTAFKIIIEKLNLKNSKIIFPAYICDIFHPILKTYNIKPIFVDIDLQTFNASQDKILNVATPEAKAVLISHTYGLINNIDKIRNLTIIEDCAHSFGLKKAGKLGAVSFFSLYKQFPSLRGGMLVCPKDWEIKLPKTSFSFRDFISLLNSFPLFAFMFKSFGSRTPRLAENFIREEKTIRPAGINNVSLSIFSQFLKDFEKELEKRKKLALLFQKELEKLGFKTQASENNVFCYVSALIPKRLEEKRDAFVDKLKRQRIFCTRIWHTPIIMNPKVQEEYALDMNNFPNTIEAAKRIVNFPLQNHYTKKDVEKIINSLKKLLLKL